MEGDDKGEGRKMMRNSAPAAVHELKAGEGLRDSAVKIDRDLQSSDRRGAGRNRLTTSATPAELLKQRREQDWRTRADRMTFSKSMRGVAKGGVVRPSVKWYPNLGPLLQGSASYAELDSIADDGDEKACPTAEDTLETALDDFKFQDEEQQQQVDSGSFLAPGSLPAAVINLGTATMGLGSLSLPKATDMAGVAAATGITFLMFVVACVSIHLLAAALEARGAETFVELSIAVGGRRLGILVEFMCMIYCFGTMVSVLLGAAKVVGIVLPGVSQNLMIFYVMLAMLPPLLVENVGALSKISCFSQLCLVYNCLIIVVYLFVLGIHDSVLEPGDAPLLDQGQWHTDLLAFGQAQGNAMGYIRASLVFIFAFANQTVVPVIYSELRDRNVRNMTKVGCTTMAIVTTIYATVNMAGFLTWGTDCNSNVLFNYRALFGLRQHAFLSLALLTSLMAAWTCFPVNAFPCKFAMVTLLNYRVPSTQGSPWVGWLVALLLVLLSYAAAVALPSLSVVLELVGATAGVAVMFVLPGGFYLLLVPRSSGEIWGPLHMRQVCYVMLVSGAVIGGLGTYSAVQDALAVLTQ